MMSVLCSVVVLVSAGAAGSGADAVHFQAHRGGLKEAPENTLAAYRYAWDLGRFLKWTSAPRRTASSSACTTTP